MATAAKEAGCMAVATAEVNVAGVNLARRAGVMEVVQMVEAPLAALRAMETEAMVAGMMVAIAEVSVVGVIWARAAVVKEMV